MIRLGDVQRRDDMINRLKREIGGIIRSALELSYYSRGAWSYDTVLAMSAGEREVAAEFINKRLEVASKMPFPVF